MQLGMQLMKSRSREKSGFVLKTQDMDSFYNALPFILTNSQQTAIEDCISTSVPPISLKISLYSRPLPALTFFEYT